MNDRHKPPTKPGRRKALEGETVRCTIIMPTKTYEKLSRLADQERRSITAQALFMIEQLLPKEQAPPQ